MERMKSKQLKSAFNINKKKQLEQSYFLHFGLGNLTWFNIILLQYTEEYIIIRDN